MIAKAKHMINRISIIIKPFSDPLVLYHDTNQDRNVFYHRIKVVNFIASFAVPVQVMVYVKLRVTCQFVFSVYRPCRIILHNWK